MITLETLDRRLAWVERQLELIPLQPTDFVGDPGGSGMAQHANEYHNPDMALQSNFAAHASRHKHGGADEVATATPAANAIPKAGAGGKLAAAWLQEVLAYADLTDDPYGDHNARHEPGGADPMAVDAVAATGSLRTLGTGAQQAAPGNDSRFVTGGDAHDHVGGDGAQIDHGGLAGLGDDDHTQYLKEKASGGAASEVPEHTHASAAQAGALYSVARHICTPDAAPGEAITAGDQQGMVWSSGPDGETAFRLQAHCETAPGASGLPITVQYGDTNDLDTVTAWTTIATLTLSSEKSALTDTMTNASIPADRVMRMNVGTIVGTPKDATITLWTKVPVVTA